MISYKRMIIFLEIIINIFKEYDCSVLLGAEYGLWPVTNYTHLYDEKPKLSDKYYLNSGTYVGYTDKITFQSTI